MGRLTLKDRRALQKAIQHKLSNKDYAALQTNIRIRLKKDYGQASRVNIVFPRQGIFLEHGAGRRRTKGRGAKPWIVPVLDPAIYELADLLVENYADLAAGEVKFFIPGIIDRRVKISADGKQ